MSVVIQVDHLSKQYRLGAIGGKRLVDDVNRWWARLRGKEDPLSKVGAHTVQARGKSQKARGSAPSPLAPKGDSPLVSRLSPLASETLWALKDVSFEVRQGEVLGIIGRNGAGKSTLLKILSRVTAPSSGEVRVKGRIASLLEVGTGFHPELTGRENIFLNGAILGMTKAEIRAKFDEIVAFAEVEKFIDTPVKRYSSGMYVRLAFAVAAHLEPEILIVDEVLAVGDAEFQKKCLGKMKDVAGEGRTVLFVSHNMAAVTNLCTKALIMERGALRFHGSASSAIAEYLDATSSQPAKKDPASFRPRWAKPYITTARLLDPEGRPTNCFPMGSDITIELDFTAPNGAPVVNPVMGVVISRTTFGTVAGVNTRMTTRQPIGLPRSSGCIRCTLRRPPLLQGQYTIDVWFGSGREDLDTLTGFLSMNLEATDVYGTGAVPFKHMGVLYLTPEWCLTVADNQ